MKIAWDNLISVYIPMSHAKRLLDGVLNHFTEDDGVRNTFSMFKMGYEVFSNCVKLSSALLAWIKNDRSLILCRSHAIQL